MRTSSSDFMIFLMRASGRLWFLKSVVPSISAAWPIQKFRKHCCKAACAACCCANACCCAASAAAAAVGSAAPNCAAYIAAAGLDIAPAAALPRNAASAPRKLGSGSAAGLAPERGRLRRLRLSLPRRGAGGGAARAARRPSALHAKEARRTAVDRLAGRTRRGTRVRGKQPHGPWRGRVGCRAGGAHLPGGSSHEFEARRFCGATRAPDARRRSGSKRTPAASHGRDGIGSTAETPLKASHSGHLQRRLHQRLAPAASTQPAMSAGRPAMASSCNLSASVGGVSTPYPRSAARRAASGRRPHSAAASARSALTRARGSGFARDSARSSSCFVTYAGTCTSAASACSHSSSSRSR
jgi:hypothetical protein